MLLVASPRMLVRTVVWGVGFIQGMCQEHRAPLDPSACRALEVVQSRGDLQQLGHLLVLLVSYRRR